MITVEFTPDLSALQGILLSADYEYSFKNLSAKGGNEKAIDSVVNAIRKFLISKNYINEKGIVNDAIDSMRQFALYIVLNSDLEVLNELVNTDSTIDLLIWTVPTIPKCLMSELLWNLHMEEFVKEIISFGYPSLASEVANAIIFNLKYMNPTECLQHLQILSTACFTMLCRMNFFDLDEDKFKSAFNNFQRCMAYFNNPPNESKLEKLQKDDLYKYYGNCLYTILNILWDCFIQYDTTQICDLNGSIAVYEVTYNNKCKEITNYKPSECTEKKIVEILNKCLTELLDKSMNLVMGINLDIFCAWSEFEEGGVSMQESIGELCYRVREKLLNTNSSDHAVISMLEQISRKPVIIEDIINITDSSAIIDKIKQNDHEGTQWLHALVQRDNLSEDIALLQILGSNLDQLNEDNAYLFFQKLQPNHLNISTETLKYIKTLVIRLFQICNTDAKNNIVDNHFKDRHFNNDMECEEFECMLTEIFNKLAITTHSDLSDVLSVFIQNPRQVFATVFKSATENEHQMNLMFEVMMYLSKYSNHYYSNETEPCLTIILRNTLDQDLSTDVKEDNYANFISKLKTADIISLSKLLLLIIMPKLHDALINRDYRSIHMQCKLIHKCYSVEDLLEYRTPMLAMLAQVMAQVRWKINTFNILGPSILNLVIDLQTSLMNSFNRNIIDNEASWLKNKLKDLDPLNMYYYRQLWNPPGNTFVEVVSGIRIHVNMDIELLTLWLAQVLSSSTLDEWKCIWGNLNEFGDAKILDLFHNAMMTVLTAEKCNRTETTWACLLYCYKNLFHCMRYKFFKEPLSNNQVLNVTHKLVTIICEIQEENAEEFGRLVTPLFAYIAERKEDYNISISENLEKLPRSKLSDMVQNLFRNGSS